MKTAIVIGATGVTGAPLVKALLQEESYAKILVFSRRQLDFEHEKLDLRIVDFEQVEQWQDQVRGDELFSAMGTTRKQAGSKAAQRRVDYTYQANVIGAAASNGVSKLMLVSSPGANSGSLLFYPRIKGSLEDFVRAQAFKHCVLFRPSLITGPRSDHRPGEKLAEGLFRILPRGFGVARRYRPIKGAQLAQAMVNCAKLDTPSGLTIYELDEIFTLLD